MRQQATMKKRVRMKRRSSRPNPCSARSLRALACLALGVQLVLNSSILAICIDKHGVCYGCPSSYHGMSVPGSKLSQLADRIPRILYSIPL